MMSDLQRLESSARKLEPDAQARAGLSQAALSYAENFLAAIDESKGFEQHDTSQQLYQLEFSERPRDLSDILDILKVAVDTPGINPASGGHLGYIPGGGIYPAALADFLADITNRYAGIYFASPGAVRMENLLVRWMSEMVGYPEAALGTLTSGGSIANLIAITTARDALKIRSADVPKTVIYMTEQTHHCVDKAIRIAGLGESVIRRIPLDSRYKMDAYALQDAIETDQNIGLLPAIAIASLGSTDTGAVDPIEELVSITSKHGIWLQVDAAYGGFFQLVPELNHLFKGVEKSDSYILDPHKGMFLPYGTGAVMIRNGHLLHESHWYRANYMQDAENPEEYSPAELSPELTRHFRGLRMWLPMQLFGLSPFRDALHEKHLLAKYFIEKVRELGFETGPEPELSVVIYRFTNCTEEANAFNQALIKTLHKDGRIFVSSTLIRGEFWLRFAALCFRTHQWHVDLLLEMLKEARDACLIRPGQ